jgi:hypothetical protein
MYSSIYLTAHYSEFPTVTGMHSILENGRCEKPMIARNAPSSWESIAAFANDFYIN